MSQNGGSRDTRTEIPDGLKAATAPKIMAGDPNSTHLYTHSNTRNLKFSPLRDSLLPKNNQQTFLIGQLKVIKRKEGVETIIKRIILKPPQEFLEEGTE